MPGILTDSVRSQIDEIELDPSRPLVICDADEVLFEFVRSLEHYLGTRDHYLDLQSFAITGNIKHRETHVPFPAEGMKDLLADFFATSTRDMTPVPGAAAALAALADQAQIVILTNMPEAHREDRLSALERHNMSYPVVANDGAKGAAAAALSERAGNPVFFLDDLPPNISSVRRGVPHATIIHFIGDIRLAKLLGPAPDCDHRIDDWVEAQRVIEETIARARG